MKTYDKTENQILMDYFTANIVKNTVLIAENKNINFSRAKCNEYFNKTAVNRINEILAEARKDSNKADIFNGLDSGRIDSLVKAAFTISIEHGIVMYANEILKYSEL